MTKSRELACLSTLDVATKLYNRSKCQELFQEKSSGSHNVHPAFVVIDLNDLKKTNDVQGHREGDKLIAVFATILKKAVEIHSIKPFIGRYGGDEFILFYEDVKQEEELETLVKELFRLTEEENQRGNHRFTVSYAIGYAINHHGNDGIGRQQLFDEADENMYSNKKTMKSKQQKV